MAQLKRLGDLLGGGLAGVNAELTRLGLEKIIPSTAEVLRHREAESVLEGQFRPHCPHVAGYGLWSRTRRPPPEEVWRFRPIRSRPAGGNLPSAASLGGGRWAVVSSDFDAAVIADFNEEDPHPAAGRRRPAGVLHPSTVFTFADTIVSCRTGESGGLRSGPADGRLVDSIPVPDAVAGRLAPRSRWRRAAVLRGGAAAQARRQWQPGLGGGGAGTPGLARFDTLVAAGAARPQGNAHGTAYPAVRADDLQRHRPLGRLARWRGLGRAPAAQSDRHSRSLGQGGARPRAARSGIRSDPGRPRPVSPELSGRRATQGNRSGLGA